MIQSHSLSFLRLSLWTSQRLPSWSERIRDELMHWMDAHTALTIPQRDDALARLHAAEPQAFLAEPLPQHIYAALQAIDEAETQRQQSVDRS